MENNTAEEYEQLTVHINHEVQEVVSAVVADMIKVKKGTMTIDDLIGKWSSNGVAE